ncbi:Bug family tripartite tricarboxylate transporter substrate binding protein [Bordetella muralis]|uniref:Bug family tripartite tricarboxylate transporter substrate binding protein n=1 Tax=Bordetella muralis TaxID=1649130 RepID=UPI0039F0BA00
MTIKRKPRGQAAITLSLALWAITPTQAAIAADAYPCKMLTLVSPYPAGGTTDILARLLSPKLQASLGTTVIVDNRGGASSNIGTEYVARAEKDGCTALLGNNTGIVINRNLYSLRMDPVQALQPVAKVAAMPLVLYVNPKVPAKTVAELVKILKEHPGTYNFASGGSGSPQHLAGELFKLATGIDALHIPYKGQGPAMMDVIAGQVQFAFETTAALYPQAQAKRVVPLATTGAERSDAFPDLPTMKQAGYPDLTLTNWYGVFVPAGIPQDRADRLSVAVSAALAEPDIQQKLTELGSERVSSDPAEFKKFIQMEVPMWENLVKRSGAKVD